MFFNDFSTFQFKLFWNIPFYWKANIPENFKNGIKEFGRETIENKENCSGQIIQVQLSDHVVWYDTKSTKMFGTLNRL